MARIIADNIISPFGFSTAATYEAVAAGHSALHTYEGRYGLPFAFTASLFSDEQWNELRLEGFTDFESLAIRAIRGALAKTDIDIASQRTALILSTTKGNVEELIFHNPLYHSFAIRIAHAVGLTTEPIVVCNACISGLHAIILADRLLAMGLYDHIIVCGADVQGRFIISGFQSLKALSPESCRPFDMERLGLNLGEAAGVVILEHNTASPYPLQRRGTASPYPLQRRGIASPYPLQRRGMPSGTEQDCYPLLGRGKGEAGAQGWLSGGFLSNDTFHISAPSRKGDGAMRVLENVKREADADDIAFINAHGTATMFNDQMESVAIERAGLNDVPVNSLKGYLGHTMGAAGVVETILSLQALRNGLILPTKGFSELGVSGHIQVSDKPQTIPAGKKSFIKMLSGFGGCNAAALFSIEGNTSATQPTVGNVLVPFRNQRLSTLAPSHVHNDEESANRVIIRPGQLLINGKVISIAHDEGDFLTAIYKKYVADYPKFYKMDPLSRLGFLATELLLGNTEYGIQNKEDGIQNKEDGIQNKEGEALKTQNSKLKTQSTALVFCNHSSSIMSDRRFWATISKNEEFYPSPSVFVYTLPNIVTGEIAIRHHLTAETSFYILPEKNETMISNLIRSATLDPTVDSVIGGWLDYEDDTHYEADISIYTP